MISENKIIITGKVTLKPIFSPGVTKNGSIDFELSNKYGKHQVVSDNVDIVSNMDLIKGKVRVIGSLNSRAMDTIIQAERIEFD